MSGPVHAAQIAISYWRRQTVLPVGPIRLWIEPTNVCNLRCPMCLTPKLGNQVPKGFMSLETFARVLEATRGQVKDVNLFLGGEPLLNKQLPEMIRIAREAGMKTRLHSNATLLSEEWAIALIDAGLDFLSFSFDGADAETYREYRVGGDFERTCENIRRFARLRAERHGAGPETVVQLIERPEWTSAQRRQEREALHALFAGPGIDRLKFIRLHNFGGLLDDPRFLAGKQFSPCSFLWYSLNVDFDGTAVACCLDFARQYPVGDLKTQTLMEVWNGPRLVALREKMIAGKIQDEPLCKGCDVPYKPRLFGIPVRDGASLREFVTGVLRR